MDGADDYIEVLRKMPNLTTILWQTRGIAPATPQLFHILVSPPSLLSFRTSNVRFPTLSPSGTGTRLRELDVLQGSRDLFTVTEDDIQTENRVLEAILAPLSMQLEILRIPGESSRLSFLAAHTWPALRELSIRGAPPRVDAPFADVLAVMPRLRVLNVAVVHIDGATLLLPTTPRLRIALGLGRLTVSDPHPEEGIFARLDGTLSELSLRDVPRYYNRRHFPRLHAPTLLLCREAARIVGMLPLCGSSLKRLEIAVREDGTEQQLLALIATSCCNLVLFELHEYRADDLEFIQRASGEVDIDTTQIATILLPLRKLRVLRLNLDLGLPVRDQWTYINPESWRPLLEAQARVIANVLPWLSSISFLTTQTIGPAGWSVWELYPSQSGTVELERISLEDEFTLDRVRF
ncbi:hypothetical protein AURDEDRAFT_176497 [Auricularia subglabra TFB-10046 SS5]|nr:hypothetical protein AURDEDRAFT_176497 [Auricularia subglabra TFB-10046 SS5]